MKIFLSLFSIILLLMPSVTSFSQEKYPEAVKVLNDTIGFQEKFLKVLTEEKKAEDVVKALGTFADELVSLQPKIKELDSRYPDMKDPEKLPGEIKKLIARIEELNKRLKRETGRVLEKYSKEPAVRKAFEDFRLKVYPRP